MTSRVPSKEFNSIDLVKFCMAFAVVAIHTHPHYSCSVLWVKELLTDIFALAVPFFFVASGFLIWNKICDAQKEVQLAMLKEWIKKTTRLYMWWTIIYLPFTIKGFLMDNIGVAKSLIVFMRNFLLVGENYLSWPLWYLLAMLVAAVLVYLMVKWNFNERTMYFVGVLLALIGFCLDRGIIQSDTYISLFKTTRNGFFVGLQYILIGIFIAKKGVIKSKMILFAMFAASMLLHASGYNMVMFIAIYSFFSLVLHYHLNATSKTTFQNMRLTSAVVYFVHMLWVGVITLLFPNLLSPVLLFSIVVIMSLLTAVIVIRNQDTDIVKILFK